jgi:hypothetical protein
MNDDQLRRALDGYATGAPDADPLPGVHARLARRARRTRAAVAGAACAVALAGAGGVVALDRGDGPAGLAAVPPTPSLTVPGSRPPSVRPTPSSPAPATSAPSPTTAPTGSPAASVDNGQATVRARGAYGLTLRTTLSPRGPLTATAVTLDVFAHDDDGRPDLRSIDWGDGARQDMPPIAVTCPIYPTQSPRPPSPNDLRTTLRHSWRTPGRHVVVVQVYSTLRCMPNPPPEEDATTRTPVDVRPGAVTTNGGWSPAVSGLGAYGGSDPKGLVSLGGTIQDDDGWARTAVVDWGDGSARTTVRNEETCDDGGGAYFPFNSRLDLYSSHRYARSGRYTITVTFTSTGCGGADPQTGRGTTTAVVK